MAVLDLNILLSVFSLFAPLAQSATCPDGNAVPALYTDYNAHDNVYHWLNISQKESISVMKTTCANDGATLFRATSLGGWQQLETYNVGQRKTFIGLEFPPGTDCVDAACLPHLTWEDGSPLTELPPYPLTIFATSRCLLYKFNKDNIQGTDDCQMNTRPILCTYQCPDVVTSTTTTKATTTTITTTTTSEAATSVTTDVEDNTTTLSSMSIMTTTTATTTTTTSTTTTVTTTTTSTITTTTTTTTISVEATTNTEESITTTTATITTTKTSEATTSVTTDVEDNTTTLSSTSIMTIASKNTTSAVISTSALSFSTSEPEPVTSSASASPQTSALTYSQDHVFVAATLPPNARKPFLLSRLIEIASNKRNQAKHECYDKCKHTCRGDSKCFDRIVRSYEDGKLVCQCVETTVERYPGVFCSPHGGKCVMKKSLVFKDGRFVKQWIDGVNTK